MDFTLVEQFKGFIRTSQIFPKNAILEYPLYPTSQLDPAEGSLELSEPSQQVLGKRMEHFFAHYITNFTSEKILDQNRQIIENKKTLGELDFLLKNNASGEVTHVELIFKFYLFDPGTGTSELEHLIGPNKRDSFNKKLQRLQKRQFPLLFHEVTKKQLTTFNINLETVVQKMCFKAAVFLPKLKDKTSLDHINPETVSGYWIKALEFTIEAFGHNAFFIPKKKFWPVDPERNNEWHSYDKIKQQIEQLLDDKFSPLVWMKKPNGSYERFFIVWW